MDAVVVDTLKSFAEGQVSSNEWQAWWLANSQRVRNAVNAGEFQRMKPLSTGSIAVNTCRAHQEVCRVLTRLDVSYQASNRYTEERDKIELSSAALEEFATVVFKTCSEFPASGGDGKFVERLFSDYCEVSPPVDREKWIRDRLKREFEFVESPPNWVNDPMWPIIDGVPAVFLFEYRAPKNSVTQQRYSSDTTIFVFGYRVVHDKGFRLEHRVVSQMRFDSSE